MDKLKELVAEQLEGEDYEITDWEVNDPKSPKSYRKLIINIGSLKLYYQQDDESGYFYGCCIVDNPIYNQHLNIAMRVLNGKNNYKRDVDFVRSILPELEAMLDKVQAYRELAR